MLGARQKESELRPRKDFAILRKIPRGQSVGGVHVPETSKEGNRTIVVAIGPDVLDLQVGDEVICGGPTLTAEFYPIPEHPDLVGICEKYCMIVVAK